VSIRMRRRTDIAMIGPAISTNQSADADKLGHRMLTPSCHQILSARAFHCENLIFCALAAPLTACLPASLIITSAVFGD